MTSDDDRSLLQHMEWADALTWTALLDAPALAHDDRARALTHHFHATQWAYLQVFRGEPVDIPERRTFPDLPSVGRWARRLHRKLAAFIEGLDAARLNRPVAFPWVAQLAKRCGAEAALASGDHSRVRPPLRRASARFGFTYILRDDGRGWMIDVALAHDVPPTPGAVR